MNKLRNTVVVLVICLFVSVAASGCQMLKINTPERQRRRKYVIRTDLDRMIDDADWVLGLRRPSRLHNEAMR